MIGFVVAVMRNFVVCNVLKPSDRGYDYVFI